jgi:hypothetical protein
VLTVIDIAMYGAILKAPMEQAMKVLPKPRIVEWQVPWYISLDVVAGIALVWLYAALRPRFGAGLATAAKAGVVGWFFTSLWTTLVQWPMNLMPLNLHHHYRRHSIGAVDARRGAGRKVL